MKTTTEPARKTSARLRYCTNCLMPHTRPRITFDDEGVCNACSWAREKKTAIDWPARWQEMLGLCARLETVSPSGFNCIVPVSGGKDSSYIAHRLKHELGMRPLCVTINPPLPMPLGERNVKNLANAGFDLMAITPNPRVMRLLNRYGLVEDGRPLLGWQIAVQAVMFRLAATMKIPLVMFAEEGETEYGGNTRLKSKRYGCYDVDDAIALYLTGNDPKRFVGPACTESDLSWFMFPPAEEVRAAGVHVAHWSYFEDWDPYRNYLVAKEHCGLEEFESRCVGTYNNFAQTDTSLFDLHIYLMYLKFGFARCTADVGIDIRRGALTRKQAVALVRQYDGEYPEQYIEGFRDYYEMTADEFDLALDAHTNKDLFEKVDGRWRPRFVPE